MTIKDRSGKKVSFHGLTRTDRDLDQVFSAIKDMLVKAESECLAKLVDLETADLMLPHYAPFKAALMDYRSLLSQVEHFQKLLSDLQSEAARHTPPVCQPEAGTIQVSPRDLRGLQLSLQKLQEIEKDLIASHERFQDYKTNLASEFARLGRAHLVAKARLESKNLGETESAVLTEVVSELIKEQLLLPQVDSTSDIACFRARIYSAQADKELQLHNCAAEMRRLQVDLRNNRQAQVVVLEKILKNGCVGGVEKDSLMVLLKEKKHELVDQKFLNKVFDFECKVQQFWKSAISDTEDMLEQRIADMVEKRNSRAFLQSPRARQSSRVSGSAMFSCQTRTSFVRSINSPQPTV